MNNHFIEVLEARVAPATLVGHNIITYTDVDGDHVTVKFSKPLFADAAAANGRLTFDTGAGAVNGSNTALETLQGIDLSGGGADGVAITITATLGAHGDGFVNVGKINSTGHDLGAVIIHGDLGRILAGDAKLTTPGLASLQVVSMGLFGTSTQSAGGSLNSAISGPVGKLSITADLNQAHFETAGAGANIGSIFIGGSMRGGTDSDSGGIKAAGDIKTAVINGDLIGSLGNNSGGLQAVNIGSLTIGGSLLGGDGSLSGGVQASKVLKTAKIGHDIVGGNGANGANSGGVSAATVTSITVGGSIYGGAAMFSGGIVGTALVSSATVHGDVRGGLGSYSGSIGSYGNVGTVNIGGSLVGPTLTTGTVAVSGEVVALGTIKSVTIGGDVRGGTISGDAHLSDSGFIGAGAIGQVIVKGSVIAGTDNSTTGALVNTGAIRALTSLGPVSIAQNLLGTTGTGGKVTLAGISAAGIYNSAQTLPAGPDLAIAKLTVGGRVDHALIEAGVPRVVFAAFGLSSGTNADAQIGAITVGGSWIASSVAAGTAATDTLYGDANDAKLIGAGVRDQANHFSKIASITIAGQVLGTPTAGDNFGFVAQQIGSVKVGGTMVPLTTGFRPIALDVAFEIVPSP